MSQHAEDDLTVHAGVDNVFAALDLPDPEGRLAKAELARVVRKQVQQLMQGAQCTQARVAELIEIAPSDLSDIMRGKLTRFSQERIERVLVNLGNDLRIVVSPVPGASGAQGEVRPRGRISVESVGAV